MHMADALLNPQVGGALWGVTAASVLYCSRRVSKLQDDKTVPLMGVLGAFIFAAQMINFTIPATGSSGHLGGGMILAILLGPAAAFLTIASVLLVQALFFADGGLLALGCNIFNLGFLPAFIAYPFIFKPLAGPSPGGRRLSLACVVSAVIALQLGSLGVVTETSLSGISALPVSSFLLVMQPIHLAIGLVEGVVTAVVVRLIWNSQPDLLQLNPATTAVAGSAWKKVAVSLLVVSLVVGGVLSWYASSQPDGLEWSVARVVGSDLEAGDSPLIAGLGQLQERIALLPDYAFAATAEDGSLWQNRLGTSVSGILGGMVSLVVIVLFGFVLRKRNNQ